MSQRSRRVWAAGLICFAATGVGFVGGVALHLDVRAAMGQDSSAPPASSGQTASTGPAQTVAISASQPAGAGLDPLVYGRVTELRERLRLTEQPMVAAGCDGPTAEAVLGRVLGWYQANAAAWDSRRSAVAAATGQLRLALGRMHAGPAALAAAAGAGGPGGAARGAGGAGGSATTVESLVAEVQAAQAAVSAAEKAESDLLAAAAENVGAGLTDAQRAQWAAIRANPAGGGEYSLLAGITADQLTALAQARTRQARLQAAAKSPTDRTAAGSDFARAEPTILTPAQAQSLAATRDALRRNLPAVLAASSKVLPPPPRRVEVVERPMEPNR